MVEWNIYVKKSVKKFKLYFIYYRMCMKFIIFAVNKMNCYGK